MEAVQKYDSKPVMRRVADLEIMLECLCEVYGSEGDVLRSGRNVRLTMAYPFLKMIESKCPGLSAKELHRILWNIYIEGNDETDFMNKAQELLYPYEGDNG